MFNYASDLRSGKKPNPFLKEVTELTLLQSRMHADNDNMLPEDQWAQITVLMKGLQGSGKEAELYAVYERRAADKLDYFDWKISFLAEEEDFRIINDVEV